MDTSKREMRIFSLLSMILLFSVLLRPSPSQWLDGWSESTRDVCSIHHSLSLLLHTDGPLRMVVSSLSFAIDGHKRAIAASAAATADVLLLLFKFFQVRTLQMLILREFSGRIRYICCDTIHISKLLYHHTNTHTHTHTVTYAHRPNM